MLLRQWICWKRFQLHRFALFVLLSLKMRRRFFSLVVELGIFRFLLEIVIHIFIVNNMHDSLSL